MIAEQDRLRILAILAAVFAAIAFAVGELAGLPGTVGLAITGLVLAGAMWQARRISSFLRVFLTVFVLEYVAFGAMVLVSGLGWWPGFLAGLLPPASLPVTVGIFGILVVAVSYIPVIRTITGIADRYFDTEASTTARVGSLVAWSGHERRLAKAAVVFLVLVNQAQVGISVRLNFFSRDWFNAIQNKDEAAFWSLLFTVFLFWAFVLIASNVIEYLVQSAFLIRWRRWLTGQYIGEWLGEGTHYRMGLRGAAADNPDQRIAEDIKQFTDTTYSFSIQLLSQISTLVSFSIILWGISSDFAFPGTNLVVPGLLFWFALVYAVFGTGVTHLIGRPLIPLFFNQQRYEADFRFSLARLREYAEQVALLEGEPTERRLLLGRFGTLVENFWRIVNRRKLLMIFTSFYGQLSVVIPYVVAAPFYFLGKVQLGTLTQTAGAFAPRRGGAVLLRRPLRHARRLQGGRGPPFDLRPGDRGRAGARARGRHPARRARARHGRGARPFPRAAGWASHRRRLRARLPPRRERARDRALGIRQVDAVSRHRRHLAVRRGRHPDARRGPHDAPAAAALHPDGNADQRRRLSVELPTSTIAAPSPRPCAPPGWAPSSIASTRSGPGPRPCRWASSSGSRWRARSSRSRIGCSSTRRRRRSTSRPRKRSTAC